MRNRKTDLRRKRKTVMDHAKHEDGFTTAEKLQCLERELARRKQVYPNRTLTKRRSEAWCRRQIALIEAIIADYTSLAELDRAEKVMARLKREAQGTGSPKPETALELFQPFNPTS